MKRIRVGLVRVSTLKDDDLINAHARILTDNFPNIDVVSQCIPDQPLGIYNEDTETMAVSKIVTLAEELQERGVDIVLISCAADPAVAECRKRLKTLVIGAGSAAASLAVALSSKIGVIRITDEVPNVIKEILGKSMLVDIKPRNIVCTLDLLTSSGRKSVMEAAEYLKARGCDTVIPACTGMSTSGIAKDIEMVHGLRVIDPVIASGVFIKYLLDKTVS